MPTYDYFCFACKHTYERFESIGDDGPKACEKCGKKKAKRRIGTGAGLIFKGAGFYVTDSKQGSSKPAEKKAETPKADAPKKEGKESKT